MGDAQVVEATAFAAVDGEGRAKFLKEKAVALFKALQKSMKNRLA